GTSTPVPYVFEDVVAQLNEIQPYDWAGFLEAKVEAVAPSAPLDGLLRGGYRLVYREDQSSYDRRAEAFNDDTNLIFSLGLTVGKEGRLTNVVWDSPAFNAGSRWEHASSLSTAALTRGTG
ncbi:MAG: hypothetical protein ABI885_28150, partial [Gammaproteobacteria bacterium]